MGFQEDFHENPDSYGMICVLGRAVLEPDQLWGL